MHPSIQFKFYKANQRFWGIKHGKNMFVQKCNYKKKIKKNNKTEKKQKEKKQKNKN